VKGIVVDLNDKYAIVMDKKGEFIKVKNNGECVVGYEIDIGSTVINHNFKALSKVVSIAAGLLLVLGIGIGAYAYNMPYNYINMDINPSLEFTVNMFEMVLDVEALNIDGEELLKNNTYKHLKIDKALGESIEMAVDEGFLKGNNESALMITISGKNYDKLSSIQEELVKAAKITLEQDKIQANVLTEKITLEERDSAKELGVSPGKFVLIEKLKQKNPDIEVGDFKEKSVKDILLSFRQRTDEPKDRNDEIETMTQKDGEDRAKPANSKNVTKGNSDIGKNNNTDNSKEEKPPKDLPKKGDPKHTDLKDAGPKKPDLKDKDKDKEKDKKDDGLLPLDKEKDKETEEGIKGGVKKDDKPGHNKLEGNEIVEPKPEISEPKVDEPKDDGPKVGEPKDDGPKGDEPKLPDKKDRP